MASCLPGAPKLLARFKVLTEENMAITVGFEVLTGLVIKSSV
jgi:hypothetical protein